MCHEWTRVWQCNHGATPQDAPTLTLCTLGQLNLAELMRSEGTDHNANGNGATSNGANNNNNGNNNNNSNGTIGNGAAADARSTQMRAACAYIEDVRVLQAGWCQRCEEQRRRRPQEWVGRELCWKDERPGSFL